MLSQRREVVRPLHTTFHLAPFPLLLDGLRLIHSSKLVATESSPHEGFDGTRCYRNCCKLQT